MSRSSFSCITMPQHAVTLALALCLVLSSSHSSARAVETNQPAAPVLHQDDTNSQEMLRVYLQLQEQLHATQLAIEQNRKEAKETAVQNAEFLASRLHDIEAALASQRTRELETMQSSNRVMLIVAGTFATFGFLVMLVIAYFQWRTVHGLAAVSATASGARALPPSEGPLVSIGPAEQSNVKLLGALEGLEKRIYELEHLSQEALHDGTGNGTNEIQQPATPVTQGNGDSSHSAEAPTSRDESVIEILLEKGLSMLNLDKPEAALTCFDEVLSQEPNNSEALVRRGIALERLQMLDDALESYNRAIAADNSMTIAYLHKGGLFNRMERFDEALACYEQALRTQERKNG